MKTYLGIFCCCLLFSGCTAKTAVLVNGADQVKIFRKSDPPAPCREISQIAVLSGGGCAGLGQKGTQEDALNQFRNEIVAKGGNTGLLMEEIEPHQSSFCYEIGYKIKGVAYKCPTGEP